MITIAEWKMFIGSVLHHENQNKNNLHWTQRSLCSDRQDIWHSLWVSMTSSSTEQQAIATHFFTHTRVSYPCQDLEARGAFLGSSAPSPLPSNQGSGKCCKLPTRVLGRALVTRTFLCFLNVQDDLSKHFNVYFCTVFDCSC